MVVDLDGTLCPMKSKEESYEDLVPYPNMVKKLEEWKTEGYNILIYTARNMRTYEGNLGLINANTSKIVMGWLNKWKVPYDELMFGKPWPGKEGFYIDDRAIRPNEFLKYSETQLNELLEKSKREIN